MGHVAFRIHVYPVSNTRRVSARCLRDADV